MLRRCSCMRTELWLMVAAFAISGCARASGEPARFSGRYGQGHVDPALVGELRVKPFGYAMLGQVTARCRVDDGVRELQDESLADVDCSEVLLVAALKEKASDVGGHVLIGRECRADEQRRGELWKSTLLTCSAKVGVGPGDPVRAGVPVSTELDPLAVRPSAPREYESPATAYRITVSFNPPVAPSAARPARPPDGVSELAVLPPSDILMGDIVARCKNDCDRAAVRYAVRAAAARIGATDIVGIVCVAKHSGILCTGKAARPESDPETNLLAR